MDTPHCTLSCRHLIRVLIGSSRDFHPFRRHRFSRHLLSVPASLCAPFFLLGIKPFLSFLPFHAAHYTPPSGNFIIPSPFLSHYLLIMHMWLAPPFMRGPGFFPSAAHRGPPFPPSPFKAPTYKSHHAPVPSSLCSSIYASRYIIAGVYLWVPSYLSASLWPHQAGACHYCPLETVMFRLCWHPITSTAPRFDIQLTKTGR